MSNRGAAYTETGRWAHQRISGKSVVLGMAYGGSLYENVVQAQSWRAMEQMAANYDAIGARMYAHMLQQEIATRGKRNTMKRAHDRNTNARLRHAQATLLGWQFVAQHIGEIVVKNDAGKLGKQTVLRWWAGHEQRAAQRLGPYTSRHRAVVAALKDMGIEA